MNKLIFGFIALGLVLSGLYFSWISKPKVIESAYSENGYIYDAFLVEAAPAAPSIQKSTLPEETLGKVNDSGSDGEKYFEMGNNYFYGRGYAQDYPKAIEFYKKAADLGHSRSESQLALIHLKGIGVPQDPKIAFDYAKKSADKDDEDGLNTLAIMYEYGYGTDKDTNKAVELYRKSASKGYPIAQFNIGRIFMTSTEVPHDYKEAMMWFQKAASNGLQVGNVAIGEMYETGLGVDKDVPKAVEFYKKAADGGLVYAQNRLGLLYLVGGSGITKNYEEAFNWFTKSANQDDAEGLFYLGQLYDIGLGTDKNETRALDLYHKAAEKGSPKAKAVLELYESKQKETKPSDIKQQ